MRIDISGWARGGRDLPHEALLRLCETADGLGFGGIWFNEFHFQEEPQAYPSTLMLASAIFARTQRLRVGSSITVTPLYHPFLLAETVAQLHWQSGGRFDLGIGRGTHPATLSALGIRPEETRQRFEQAHALIVAALHGEARIEAGQCWPESGIAVGPLLPGEALPVYLAGSTPDTLAFAARNRLPLLLSLEPPETAQIETYSQILSREGHPSCLRQSSLSRFVRVAPSDRAAIERVDALLPRLFERRLKAARAAGRPTEQMRMADRDTFLARQMIAGSPESCVRQLRQLEAETGIGSIRLVFNGNGVIGHEEATADLMLFGREALPHLR
ncbi:LLM class flavin-dependent oxidoreductase [Nitratireductor pacificus]|uniref:Alkanal monooxygenase subunit alpha n=1 Tax=Nitratireductor pacificus pht-3B TaxID=391937 RepID=K2MEX4_9HYPH|nr:LLM class flavin-dependent oxidoreductase [Nitratireductor pacificus]EKF19275.1 alkanal monooxygenase subunit alpha [Nitratireductor pacificus pht-3B]